MQTKQNISYILFGLHFLLAIFVRQPTLPTSRLAEVFFAADVSF